MYSNKCKKHVLKRGPRAVVKRAKPLSRASFLSAISFLTFRSPQIEAHLKMCIAMALDEAAAAHSLLPLLLALVKNGYLSSARQVSHSKRLIFLLKQLSDARFKSELSYVDHDE